MKRQIVFLADECANNSSLLQNLGTEHKLGGAEQDDLAMLHYLDKQCPILGTMRCDEVPRLPEINPEHFYLVGNFATLHPVYKGELARLGNYAIYEHDHKYCRIRNPAMYKDMIVPEEELCNLEFYSNAKAVFCMTQFHKKIVDQNITANTIALTGSFWMPEEMALMKRLNKTTKVNKAFIYGNTSQHKGLKASIEMCHTRGMAYDIIPNQPTREEFLTKLAGYQYLVFLPGSPETCSRLVLEALMVGTRVITSNIVGATHETWYHDLKGIDLIKEFERTLMPRAIVRIAGQITCQD